MNDRYLVAIAHEVVGGDERLVDNHPARVLRSLDQQVGQRRDRHVWLVGAVQQVWKQQLVLLHQDTLSCCFEV